MRLIWTLAPKGMGGLVLLVVFLFMFCVAIGRHLLNPKGILLLAAALVPLVAIALTGPARLFEKWEQVPNLVRGICLGILAYIAVVTIGNFAELYNFRLWLDFLLLRGGAPWSSVHSVALVGALYAIASQAYDQPLSIPPDEERIVSGHRLLPVDQARGQLSPGLNRSQVKLFWGTLELPEEAGTQHFCIVGASGSGKSKSIQLLMQSVLPNIRRRTNRRAIVYDAKRDIYATLIGMNIPEDQITILNPFDKRCAAWDMAKDIADPATAAEIAAIFTPEEADRQNPFFPKAAQSLVGGVMEAFIHVAPGRWTFRDVILALRTDARLKAILSQCPSTAYIVEKYLPGTDTQHDIAATIENTMRRLAFVAAAWDHAKTSFSLDEWIKGESILLLGSNPGRQSTVQQLNAAIFHRLAEIVLDQPNADKQPVPPQTWFFIDELRRAGDLPQLPELLVEGRSKGACVAIGFQDIPGLFEVYQENRAEEIIGACRNKAFLKITDPKTAKYASNVFDKQEVEITRYSPSWSVSETEGSFNKTLTMGVSVNRSLHTRPVIDLAKFQQIKEANPQNGIGGYYYLAEIGEPYFSTLPGQFVDETLQKPSPSALDVEPRPPEHQILRDWTPADLDRLGLSDFSKDLLSKPKKQSGGKNPHDEPGEGGILALLPKQKP